MASDIVFATGSSGELMSSLISCLNDRFERAFFVLHVALHSFDKIGNKIVFLRRRSQDFAIARIHDQGLGGLRAAVNAEQEGSHGM